MIIYVDTKSGKVDITKAELEKLLKERYDEGYKNGQKFCGSVTYSCPYGYGNCPYYYKRPYYSPFTCTSASDSTIEGTTISSGSISSDNSVTSATNVVINTGTDLFKQPDSTTSKEK